MNEQPEPPVHIGVSALKGGCDVEISSDKSGSDNGVDGRRQTPSLLTRHIMQGGRGLFGRVKAYFSPIILYLV